MHVVKAQMRPIQATEHPNIVGLAATPRPYEPRFWNSGIYGDVDVVELLLTEFISEFAGIDELVDAKESSTKDFAGLITANS